MGNIYGQGPSHPIPQKSQTFGMWTCIDEIPVWDESKRRWFFWFQCKCGTKKLDRHKGDITNGKSIQCLSCAKGGNLVGKQFGKWEVIEFNGIDDRGQRSWKCKCKCKYETTQIISTGTLKSGSSKGCKRCNPGSLMASLANKDNARITSDKRRNILMGKVPPEWFDLPRTKSEAIQMEKKLYFQGHCLNGHIELHHISYSCPTCSRERRVKWEIGNPEKLRSLVAGKNMRRSSEPINRMIDSLRTRTAYAFRKINTIKDESTMVIVGCSRIELKQWIEKQFYPNPDNGIEMTWENFGRVNLNNDTWNVDHKVPLAIAGKDFKKILELTHYTNLQPMWAKENIVKGSVADGIRYGEKPGPKPRSEASIQ